MEYRKIVSVTGLTGLFELVGTQRDGAIVRNLDEKTPRFVSARIHNATPLESIEIYTLSENVRLHEVFQKMKESQKAPLKGVGKNTPAEEIKGYFQEVFPQMDFDRVYTSDMKRILRWYEILEAHDLLNFDSLLEAGGEEEHGTETPAETMPETAEPAKKPRARKKASPASPDENEKDTVATEKATRAKKEPRTAGPSKKEKGEKGE